MTKSVIAILFVAFGVYALHYVNEVVTQYNNLSWNDKVTTTIYCSTQPMTTQDRIDCSIINHL